MYKGVKRALDVTFSLIGTVVSSPILLAVAAAVKLDSKGPVIFKQERLGKDGKVFEMYKFRSMCVGAEHMGTGQYSYKGDSRVTRVGKIIRATSLDELPQFINILKGDMSFIGPRPLLCEYLELYTPYQMRRHEVLPGISGLAQVNGRNAITWEEKFDYDVYYVDHMSFWLDLRILFKTIKNTLKRADINCSDNNTMEKFRGTPAAKEKR